VAMNLMSPKDNPLPLPVTEILPIPLHSLHRLYATAILQMYRLGDYLAARR